MVGPAVAQGRGLRWQQRSKPAQSRMREAGPMSFVRFVGLDVHKDSITIAVAEGDRAPDVVATIPHDIPKLLRKLRKLGPIASTSCCYEAGPTGFGLYRALKELGIDCTVVAPGLVPKK